MEPENFSPYALALYNYKLFENFKRKAENPNEETSFILSLNELFTFIDNNFMELHDKNNLTNLLPILHYTMQLESKASSTKTDISQFFLLLLNKYVNSEDNQRIALQIYYQLLTSLQYEYDVSNGNTNELFQTMCDLLFACSKPLATNILSCIQLQIIKLQRSDLVELLWQKVVHFQNKENLRHRLPLILVHLIDEFLQHINNFYRNESFSTLVQTLLVSSVREERKAAIYLLKKIIPITIHRAKDVPSWEVDHSAAISYSWSAYITVLASLEEKQSHLILPTLESIKHINLNKIWLDLLYRQLLNHNNNLVVRWTIEYMMKKFKCSDLSQELLEQFLQAANKTNLYNYDNYCLSDHLIRLFLNCDLCCFLDTFGDINWKSVPLNFWLRFLSSKNLENIEVKKETLIKIASRVRVLQNKNIRQTTVRLYENCFEHQIASMNIEEYLNLIESLYNVSDSFKDYNLLVKKLKKDSDLIAEIKISKHLYEIVSTFVFNFGVISLKGQYALLDIFQEIPKDSHGWFRFLFVFDFRKTKKQIAFCVNKYDINISADDSLAELSKNFIEKLVCQKSEKPFVHEKSVDFYVQKLSHYIELLSPNHSIEHLIDIGGKNTVLHISNLLAASDFRIENSLLECFLNKIKKFSRDSDLCFQIYENLFTSINNIKSNDKVVELVEQILNSDFDDHLAYKALFSSYVSYAKVGPVYDILFRSEVEHGDARVERRYEYEQDIFKSKCNIREDLINYIIRMHNKKLEVDFLEYLLNMNADISKKKPRYFENSLEHRIKIRIASTLLRFLELTPERYWRDEYWTVIFEQNNQLNITYFYERIIAHCLPNVNEILKYLHKVSLYTTCQQVSIIAICCTFCMINWLQMNIVNKQEIINNMLPLTMGANFQIRLYSQLAIYKMLILSKQTSDCLSNTEQLITAIQETIGEQLIDLLSDIRLDVDAKNILNDEVVLFVTNAPFDELPYISDETKQRYSKCKEIFCKKFDVTLLKTLSEKEYQIETSDFQRKINPITDIIPENPFISYPECQSKKLKDSDIIVVATLIDKLPNLGGVARTCEVLGIKNLVISSEKHIQKDEFKNLSMTAEKGLTIEEVKYDNLMKFLIQKQIEGYQIVGAEQTVNSKSFVDFKFPKRCIILLGHEKEGIPANILSILNHAVEIPQFGMVRSLNVHVTGALFMWEYCVFPYVTRLYTV